MRPPFKVFTGPVDTSVAADRTLPVHIRWMIRRDMPDVLSIETHSFEFPWCENDFVLSLRNRNCIGMVAEASERVVGFMVYELHKQRLQLVNLAVHDAFRRRRVGEQLITKLLGKLSPDRRSRVVTEVRETNLPAQLFFRALGFRAVRIRSGFYADTDEDAYVMQFRWRAATGQ